MKKIKTNAILKQNIINKQLQKREGCCPLFF